MDGVLRSKTERETVEEKDILLWETLVWVETCCAQLPSSTENNQRSEHSPQLPRVGSGG